MFVFRKSSQSFELRINSNPGVGWYYAVISIKYFDIQLEKEVRSIHLD
jgi:hypothetical protein